MSSDFSDLDGIEFENIPALYDFAKLGVNVSREASGILLASAQDLKQACLYIPVINGGQTRKANRASRPLRRAAMHMWAIQRCVNVLPRVFLKTYEEELGVARGKGRKGIDLKK